MWKNFCSVLKSLSMTSPSCTHPTNYPELPGRHHISLHEVGHPERANQAVIIARTKAFLSGTKIADARPGRKASQLSRAENSLRKRDLKIDASERSEDIHKFCGKVRGNRFLDRTNCVILQAMLPVCLNYVHTRKTDRDPRCRSLRIQASARVSSSTIR